MIDVNLKGVFNCIKVVVFYMKVNGYGCIVIVVFNVGLCGNFG